MDIYLVMLRSPKSFVQSVVTFKKGQILQDGDNNLAYIYESDSMQSRKEW